MEKKLLELVEMVEKLKEGEECDCVGLFDREPCCTGTEADCVKVCKPCRWWGEDEMSERIRDYFVKK